MLGRSNKRLGILSSTAADSPAISLAVVSGFIEQVSVLQQYLSFALERSALRMITFLQPASR